MSCTYDVFKIKVKKEEHAKMFAELWNKVLGEGDYLYDFDEDTNLFEEFVEESGSYVLNIEDEPLFAYDDGGNQIQFMITSFIERVPDVELEANYTCTFDNCPDALYNTYNYSNGRLIIRCAYSESGEGDYCPECDEELEIRLIELEPEHLVEGYICPLCGEIIEYEASVDVFNLELVNGKWKYPEGFTFGQQIEDEYENEIADDVKTTCDNENVEQVIMTEAAPSFDIVSSQLACAKVGDEISIGQWFINYDTDLKNSIRNYIQLFGEEGMNEYFKSIKGEKYERSMEDWLADDSKKLSNVVWRVVDISDRRALLVSEGIIGAQAFNKQINPEITWEKCDLRTWLEEEFFSKAFSAEEKSLIVCIEAPNDSEAPRRWKGYEGTQDKVFILSRNEIEKYFLTDKDRIVHIDASIFPNIEGYWVRTPGKRGTDVTVVINDGSFIDSDPGRCQCNSSYGVRIAMWVSLGYVNS